MSQKLTLIADASSTVLTEGTLKYSMESTETISTTDTIGATDIVLTTGSTSLPSDADVNTDDVTINTIVYTGTDADASTSTSDDATTALSTEINAISTESSTTNIETSGSDMSTVTHISAMVSEGSSSEEENSGGISSDCNEHVDCVGGRVNSGLVLRRSRRNADMLVTIL